MCLTEGGQADPEAENEKGGEHYPVSPTFFINFIKLHVDSEKSILWMGGDEWTEVHERGR